MPGDADIAATGALLGDRARARIVTALGDGRALPASVLADEAGVAASTASGHLGRLVEGGLLAAERHGRHRYFRLAGPDVARMLEAMARVCASRAGDIAAPGDAGERTADGPHCYDHLAGRLGTGLMAAMISGNLIDGGDGLFDPAAGRRDRLSGRGQDIDYRLTARGAATLAASGATSPCQPAGGRSSAYCVDWSEQRHHISGAVGAAILNRMLELRWIVRQPRGRAVFLTPAGAEGLREAFGFEVDPAWITPRPPAHAPAARSSRPARAC